MHPDQNVERNENGQEDGRQGQGVGAAQQGVAPLPGGFGGFGHMGQFHQLYLRFSKDCTDKNKKNTITLR